MIRSSFLAVMGVETEPATGLSEAPAGEFTASANAQADWQSGIKDIGRPIVPDAVVLLQ